MYFQQFYLTCLSHASYMIGSEGVACVVDPPVRGYNGVTAKPVNSQMTLRQGIM